MDNNKGESQLREDEIRDRAIRLFTFLRELTELRTTTVRNCDQYEKVIWFDDIPQEVGCDCIAWSHLFCLN